MVLIVHKLNEEDIIMLWSLQNISRTDCMSEKRETRPEARDNLNITCNIPSLPACEL